MADRVLVEIFVAAPIDTVWKSLRDPVELRRWFGWDHPTLADELDAMFLKNVVAREEEHVLHAEGMSDRFTLEAADGGTIVRVIRSAPVTDGTWKGIYSEVMEGWLTMVQQLKFALERHPGVDRRTLFLNGRAKSAATPQPIEALGLSTIAVVPGRERYRAVTAAGETLEGTVWHRGVYQLGLTIDGYGDGLVVLNNRPRTAKSPHGGGNVVITTYGLDDAVFAALRERWTAWWRGAYEVIEIQP